MANDILDSFQRQLQVESGDRQFDSHGQVTRSPKGAIGAAQVLPSTGKEAAAWAGIPWDENRFNSDHDYNVLIGSAYKSKMLGQFDADDRAATAAYNGGPGRIAGLQRQYGANWEAHLTGETHDYLDSVRGALPSTVPAAAQTAPSSAMTTTSTTPQNPELAVPRARVAAADSGMMDILDQASQAVSSIQAGRVADAVKTAGAKKAILDDTESATRELGDRVKPIFAERAAIAHRIVELDHVNPFKKAILGIFNPNYNADTLKERDSHLAAEAAAAGDEYKTNTDMQNTLMAVVNGRYESNNAIATAQLASVDSTLGMADRGLNQLHQSLQDAVQGVQADAQLTSAKASMRVDAMSQMTQGQINAAISEAGRSGGFAMVNGVPISAAELTQRSQQLEGQELSIKGQRIGVASGELSLQQNQEDRLISHMSSADIKSAIDAGGQFKGVQLDSGRLTAAYATSLQQNDLMAGAAGEAADANSYAKTVDGLNQGMTDTMRRVGGIVGAKLPPQMQQGFMSMISTVNRYSQAIRSAPTPQAANKLRSTFLPAVQKMYGEIDTMLDTQAKAMTRNPDGQLVIKSWMTGAQLTPEQATRGLIALTTGGSLPPGVRLSGPAAASMTAARNAVSAVYAKYAPNQAPTDAKANFAAMMAANGKNGKPSAAQLQQELMEAVSHATAGAWVNSNVNTMMDQLPQMAAADKSAAGRINPSDYRAARAAGDSQGLAALATRLGWSEQQAESVFGNNGSGKAGFDKQGSRKDGVTYEQAAQSLPGLQTQYFLRALDTSPSASHDFQPSAALVDYMGSSHFQQRVSAFQQQTPHVGFGEMLADAASGGSIGQIMHQYAGAMSQAAGANEMADQDITRSKIQAYKGSPIKRATVILSAVPGMAPQDRVDLMKAVTQGIRPDLPADIASKDPILARSETRSDIGKIDSIILHGKFEDPRLEKLRQLAAKHWVTYSAAGDSITSQLMHNLLGGF